MNKEEFIKFLEAKAAEAIFSSHFARAYTNSDDYWNWYVFAVDGLQPDINLSVDGIVSYTHDKTLYLGDESITEEFTYEEFIEKFYKIKH